MYENGQPRGSIAGDDAASFLQHLMSCGEMVAAQLPSPSSWTAEKRLAAAVLSAALIEIRDWGADHRRRKRLAEDLQWIASDHVDWPFSFVRLCQLFGLEPDWVRAMVRQWQQSPGKKVHRSRFFKEAA